MQINLCSSWFSSSKTISDFQPLQSLNAHVYILKASSHQQDKAVEASFFVQLLHLDDNPESLSTKIKVTLSAILKISWGPQSAGV